MTHLLIKNACYQGTQVDLLISDNLFSAIGSSLAVPEGAEIFDACGMAITPAFYNAHTHAAMALFRGYADDLELFTWLQEHIWPAEAMLTAEDIYDGSRLAILEMIKTGTVFFNDMYWHQTETVRAAEEMGVRAALGLLYIESSPGVILERNIQDNEALLAAQKTCSERIMVLPAPHSIYTVSGLTLALLQAESARHGNRLHIHAAETAREVADCLEARQVSPISYLDRFGLLGPGTILAHCCHLTDADLKLIKTRDCVIAHNPCSNMKLASGNFRFQDAGKAGIRIALGTDGCSSNNNLSMLEEMKFAALNAKISSGDPTAGSSTKVFQTATTAAARAFGLNAGEIAVGKLADCLLWNTNHPLLATGHNLTADLVYAADSSCLDTVICDGRILMRQGVVDGEQEIINRGREAAKRVRARRDS